MIKKEKEYLTSQEFADRRNKALGTVVNWRHLGKGPRYETDGAVRYPMEEILKWEATLLRSSTAGNTKPFASRVLPGAKIRGKN